MKLKHLARDFDLREENRLGDLNGQSTIPGQKATAFEPGPFHDLPVGGAPDLGGVVPRHPGVPGQSPQHPVGEKPGEGTGNHRRLGWVVSPPFI
jgi:hypothetical protein